MSIHKLQDPSLRAPSNLCGGAARAPAEDVASGGLKAPEAGRPCVGYWSDLLEHKDSFIRGATFLVGGLALVLAGTLVGLASGKPAQITAGLVAITGIVVMFLGAFLYIVPPLLPAK